MSFVCFLSSVDCTYFICGDFNIHVDVPCTDSHKLKALLESCNLRQSVNNTTHLHGHILDFILSPSDQDMSVHVDICEFISDHAVIKCAIDIPSSPATCQTRISYRRYHRINMSDGLTLKTGCQRPIALLSHSDVNLNNLGVKIKVNTTGVIFNIKLPGVIVLQTGTKLPITGN